MPTLVKFQSDDAGNPLLVKVLCCSTYKWKGPSAIMHHLSDVALRLAGGGDSTDDPTADHRRYITKVEAEYAVGMVAVYAAVPYGVTPADHTTAIAQMLLGLGLGVSR